VKKIFILALFITIVIGLCGCFDKSETLEESISVGDYVMEKSEEIAKPTVQIKDDNKFIFNYSPISSYMALGTYEVDDDSNLILKTDDGKFQFVFKVKERTLIFNSEESAEMSSYVNIPDGSIFKLNMSN
jgi:hypothetical protein